MTVEGVETVAMADNDAIPEPRERPGETDLAGSNRPDLGPRCGPYVDAVVLDDGPEAGMCLHAVFRHDLAVARPHQRTHPPFERRVRFGESLGAALKLTDDRFQVAAGFLELACQVLVVIAFLLELSDEAVSLFPLEPQIVSFHPGFRLNRLYPVFLRLDVGNQDALGLHLFGESPYYSAVVVGNHGEIVDALGEVREGLGGEYDFHRLAAAELVNAPQPPVEKQSRLVERSLGHQKILLRILEVVEQHLFLFGQFVQQAPVETYLITDPVYLRLEIALLPGQFLGAPSLLGEVAPYALELLLGALDLPFHLFSRGEHGLLTPADGA